MQQSFCASIISHEAIQVKDQEVQLEAQQSACNVRDVTAYCVAKYQGTVQLVTVAEFGYS